MVGREEVLEVVDIQVFLPTSRGGTNCNALIRRRDRKESGI